MVVLITVATRDAGRFTIDMSRSPEVVLEYVDRLHKQLNVEDVVRSIRVSLHDSMPYGRSVAPGKHAWSWGKDIAVPQ
jgi:hypothetical protein